MKLDARAHHLTIMDYVSTSVFHTLLGSNTIVYLFSSVLLFFLMILKIYCYEQNYIYSYSIVSMINKNKK